MKITFTGLDGAKIEFKDVLTFEVDFNSIRIFYFDTNINSMVVVNRVIDGGDTKMEVDFEGYHDSLLGYLDRVREYTVASKKFYETNRLKAWRRDESDKD